MTAIVVTVIVIAETVIVTAIVRTQQWSAEAIVAPTIGMAVEEMIDFYFHSGWLTLNRTCNLRCKWCYARDTAYEPSLTMNTGLAYQLIDFFSLLHIKNITLIGGEPTIHPSFFDILRYAKNKGIQCGVVTNGLMFSDKEFINKYISAGMRHISISLKGENREVYKEITGYDRFQETINIIEKLISNDISVSISMVLTEQNISSFIDIIPTLIKIGVIKFYFSFCYDFNMVKRKTIISNPILLLNNFKNVYKKLHSITHGNFRLQNGFPLCYWDQQLLKTMVNRKQISTVCQLLGRKGLIFDSEGYQIPCNAMHAIRLGKFNDDFYDLDTFKRYLKTDLIQKTYQKLCGVPDEQCLKCNELVYCDGGCVCQWTNYQLKDFMPNKN